MIFRQLFDYETWTYTYLLGDEDTKDAMLIDTVREQAERDVKLLEDLGLKLKYVLNTHLHANHITGADTLRKRTGAKTGISKNAGVSCADFNFQDGDMLNLGKHAVKVIHTPGHTDSCVSYYVDGMVFTGDVLFVRDVGRTDFQQGSNEKMYASIQKLFALPADTKVFPAHDYRGHQMSTIAEEKALNPKVGGKSFAEFKATMDAMKLGAPKKIHIALPANMLCGVDPN